MTDLSLTVRSRTIDVLHRLWTKERIWLISAAILALLFIFAMPLGVTTAGFVAQNLANVAPFLALSVAIAAYAGATGADGLIARAFTGSPVVMILIAAAIGGLSPFCSCGVIPLIAALLAMGVPLSAVMAFWLASPVMDPSMFFLTTGVLGFEFAVAKTLAALGLGILGGFTVHILSHAGGLSDPLRDGVGNGGCGGAKVRTVQPVVWKFWRDETRVAKFWREGIKTTLFLAKWLTLAFLLESLMLAWLPADLVARSLGGTGLAPIAIATLVGVPAYLNGYAALPLVGGLMGQGMAPGAGMAFLVAGGVSSLPAAIAVWALVKREVFALYLTIALTGSFAIGLLFQLWTAL
ncbi:permease [Pseudophaeobacter flagellatus]|uniref:permease n=1 Tax=Pseudophaeobacter flagellatus TaxID=2899119 RepID=UPI001E64A8E0|nr:permease [Pseudophaeobacter flagellatus]MCD9146478.1 permease [Pseudophaeobacter flagellatus]